MSITAESYNNNLSGIINEGLQHSLYDFFPGLIYIYDLGEKRLCYINKRVTESLGFSHDDLKEWDHDLPKLIYKEDIELVQKELEQYHELKENDTHSFQCRLNRKEGDYHYFQITGKILQRNDKGKAASVLFLAQDINEYAQSVTDSRVSTEILDDTENLLQFATWKWDVASDQVKWSKGVCALLNYSPKDFEKMVSSDFFMSHVLPDDKKQIDVLYNKAVENKQRFLSFEYSIETHNKEIKKLRANIKFHYADSKLIGAFGINRDITEKSKLLNKLLSYREMVMEKERFLGQGTWEMDLLMRTAFWSDGMYILFGYDPEKDRNDLIINEDLYQKHLSAEDFEKGKVQRKAALENENSYVWDYQITTNQGETKQLETFGKIIRDIRGRAVKVIGTTRDVTQVINYERELERKIAELKRSNKDLEDFAYVASHDMHEPLRKVHSFADRLKIKYGSSLDEEATGYLDRILAATQNARLMIDGLMAFSRLSTKGYWFEKVNLNALITEVINDLELTIEETHAQMDVGPLPEIDAIRIQIKQLMTNIISNALKFRKNDVAPVIAIKSKKLTRQETDQLNLDLNSTYYKITIKDNGIGFEEEYAEIIFQMFQRLNSRSEYPGSGIGLALCKKITENHQGIIRAASNPGEGTVISVIVPSNLSKHV